MLRLAHPRHWLSWLLIAWLYALAQLPLPLLYALGQGLGRLVYVFAGTRRRIARINLQQCCAAQSPAERERLLRDHFGALGVAALGQGIAWSASPARLKRLVRVRNEQLLEQRIAARQPTILLVPHFVGLDIGAAGFYCRFNTGCYLYQRIRNPVINAQIAKGRSRIGTVGIERRKSLRAVVRPIQRGIPLYYLPDQDPGRRRGIFVPFCGQPAATVPTLARLARLTQATVIPISIRLLPRGAGIEVNIQPPLRDFPTSDLHEDTARMNQCIEEMIHAQPAQYFWVHRRFKTRPPGQPPLY